MGVMIPWRYNGRGNEHEFGIEKNFIWKQPNHSILQHEKMFVSV
jgi:hypothetical protein